MSDFPNKAFRANPELDDNRRPDFVPDPTPAAANLDPDATVGYDMTPSQEGARGDYHTGPSTRILSEAEYHYGENTGRKGDYVDMAASSQPTGRSNPMDATTKDVSGMSVGDSHAGAIGSSPAYSSESHAGAMGSGPAYSSDSHTSAMGSGPAYSSEPHAGAMGSGSVHTNSMDPGRGRESYSQAGYGRDQGSFRNPPPYPGSDLPGGGRRGGDRREKKVKAEKGNSFGKRILKTVAAALIFGLVAGAAFTGVNRLMGGGNSGDTSKKIEKSEPSDGGSVGNTSQSQNTQVNVTAVDYTQVVEEVMPSVVAITGTFTQQGWFGQTYSGEGAGSGFITEITDKEILIGTNNHVVEGGQDIKVLFDDETSVPATVVGTDKDSDLAVLSVKTSDVKEETLKAIKTVTFSEEEVKVGQAVIAIGNALGYGQSVTTGVISAKNRRVSFTDGSMTLLQTDAAINPGNSGGILINTSGQVIGINNAKLEDTSVEGMCYAIPVSRAVPILQDLKKTGTVNEQEQAYLGIHGQTVDASYSEMYDIPAGVAISSIIPGSPAEQAGLQTGDVIISFDGNEISTMEGLQSRISRKKAGEKVALTIKRKNGDKYEDKEVTVTMGKKSDMPQTSQNPEPDTQDPESGDDQYDQYNWEDILPYIFGN